MKFWMMLMIVFVLGCPPEPGVRPLDCRSLPSGGQRCESETEIYTISEDGDVTSTVPK